MDYNSRHGDDLVSTVVYLSMLPAEHEHSLVKRVLNYILAKNKFSDLKEKVLAFAQSLVPRQVAPVTA